MQKEAVRNDIFDDLCIPFVIDVIHRKLTNEEKLYIMNLNGELSRYTDVEANLMASVYGEKWKMAPNEAKLDFVRRLYLKLLKDRSIAVGHSIEEYFVEKMMVHANLLEMMTSELQQIKAESLEKYAIHEVDFSCLKEKEE